jgi:thiamine pyrophosphokinase
VNTQDFGRKLAGCQEILLLGPLYQAADVPPWSEFAEKVEGVVLVDGGVHHKQSVVPPHFSDPIFSVGDGDSADKSLLDLVWPNQKDQSDLALALDLLPKTLSKLWAFGLIGGRKDHELAVMGEMHRFLLTQKSSCAVYLCYEQIFLGPGRWDFTHQGHFAVMPLEATQIRMVGRCQYPVTKDRQFFPLSSLGISNHADGVVTIENSKPVLLYFAGKKVSTPLAPAS